MADEKGGSDLDVFEGLAKKSTARPTSPGLAPPPGRGRPQTLVGLPPAPLPPPTTSAVSTQLPPPSMPKSSAPFVPPPPSAGGRPLPPPAAPPGAKATPPPPPPPGAPSGSGAAALPAAALPPPAPPPTSSAGPGRGTLPLPTPPPSAVPPAGSAAPAVGGALPAPLPPPASPAPAVDLKKKGAGEMDWDDENASTQLFAGQQDNAAPTGPRPAAGAPLPNAAAALLAGSGGMAVAAKPVTPPPGAMPLPMPQAQQMPSTPPPPTEPSPRAMPARAEEPTVVRPRPDAGGGSKAGVILGGLALVVVVALAIFMFLPKKGQVNIDIKANSGAPIAKAEIYIDGQKKCDTTPCVVTDLEPGPRTIKIIAPDFMTPPLTVSVEAGGKKDVVIPVDLNGATGTVVSTAAQPTVTTLKIGGSQQGIKVFVDDVEKGGLPLEIKDIKPGSHKVRLEGGERYEKLEQTVDIAQGQVKDLGALKLKVLKGQVALELGTDGAKVTLIRTGDKKVEKKLDDAVWKTQPVKIEINPTETWKLVATKKGFDEFTQDISFDDGNAEKTIKITLTETGKAPPATTAVASAPPEKGSTQTSTTPTGKGTSTTPPPEKSGSTSTTPPDKGGSTASGTGTLNINSIPVSKVVLDGRPIGSTPKVGVSVPAGSHTVTFIHSELGKQTVSVTVKAGETKTAAVKFK